MSSVEMIWLFHGATGRFASAVFRNEQRARGWIEQNRLSGTLTAYPVDEGVFDWARRSGLLSLSADQVDAKALDPAFVGAFTTASQQHYHFENGDEA